MRTITRLLVVGYSFGDFYLNGILRRISRLHGDARRIAVVTYYPGKEELWSPAPAVSDWPGRDMLEFLGAATRQSDPLGNPLTFHNPLISRDGRCRIYPSGTSDAFAKHGEEIVEFLSA